MTAVYICGFCLQLLALSPVLAITATTLLDVGLALATALVLLLTRSRIQSVQLFGLPILILVFSSLIVIQLFRFIPSDFSYTNLFFLKGALFAIVGISLLANGIPAAMCNEKVRIIARVGIILACVSFANVYLFDLNREYVELIRWSGGGFWLVFSVSMIYALKLYADDLLRVWMLHFVRTSTFSFILIAVMGLARTGSLISHHSEARDQFVRGEYDAAGHSMENALVLAETLGVKKPFIERMLSSLGIEAWRAERPDGLLLLGETAARNQTWSWFAEAFEKGIGLWPKHSVVHAQYTRSLFETGSSLMAIGMLEDRIVSSSEMLPLTYLAIFYVRTRNWNTLANYSEALYDRWFGDGLFPSGSDFLYGKVGAIIPQPLLLKFGDYITLSDVVRILEVGGGRVYYGKMEIGETGVTAPVDIETYSGGGSNWSREDIWINGVSVSPKKRGYNIAVIDPASGAVEAVASFDTWENKKEGGKLYDFLRLIPHGNIVVGTVRDEGSSGLVPKARDEMTALGVKHFPPYWGSHSFIGVKGAGDRRVPEAWGKQDNPVCLAVLGKSWDPNLPKDPVQLEQFLRDAGNRTNSRYTVYISGIQPDDIIAIAKNN